MHNLGLALLLVAGTASFDSLKKDAVALDHPANVIKVLVGACDVGGGAMNGECLENAKDVKDRVTGKRVLLDLGAGYDQLLTWGGRVGGKARFVWAPLYDVGNGLALTVGKPQKVAAGGNVVVGKRPVDGTSPEDLTDLDLQRLAATGQLGIQVIGKFGKTWTLSGDGRTVKGVAFEVEALRLYHARTGATVFESTQALR